MISLTVLIPFPVSASFCTSINLLLSPIILYLFSSWFAKLFILLKKHLSTSIATRKVRVSTSNNYETSSICSNPPPPSDDVELVLPDDAWAEVLCRLPPKRMVRFKSVSKSWNKLITHVCIPKITSPILGLFVHTCMVFTGDIGPNSAWHFACINQYERRNSSSSFMDSCYRLLPFTPGTEYLLDSSNGFLLVLDPLSGIFYVCNPSTEQCIELPLSPDCNNPRGANLIIDWPHFYVVYLLRGPLRMYIYSSTTRRWIHHSRLELEDDSDSVLKALWISHIVFLDGYLYVVSMSGHLVIIDIDKVSARAIKLPKIVEGKIALGCIGVSKGNLHYAWNDQETLQSMVWVLDQCEWVLKHTLSLGDFAKYTIPCILDDSSLLAVCAFHPMGEVVYLAHKVGIFCYHFGSKKLEFVYRVRSGTTISCPQAVIIPFLRNLATLDVSTRISKKIRKKQLGLTSFRNLR